jgi:hypothetical protein
MPDISDTGGDTGAQSQYSWLWLVVAYFMPDISDTGGDTGAQSLDKVKMMTFLFTVPIVVYFMPNIFDIGGDTDALSQYSWLCWHQTKLK